MIKEIRELIATYLIRFTFWILPNGDLKNNYTKFSYNLMLSDLYRTLKIKEPKEWFNEYQKVEDYIISELGEEYVKIDFSVFDKNDNASKATILMIEKLINLKAK